MPCQLSRIFIRNVMRKAKARGMTDTEVAHGAGLSKATLSRLVNNKTNVLIIHCQPLADSVGVKQVANLFRK